MILSVVTAEDVPTHNNVDLAHHRPIAAGDVSKRVSECDPPGLIVAAGGLLCYRAHVKLRQDRDMVVHTYQVIGATRAALLAAEDAETGQRGFIITGDPVFLEPYEKARNEAIPASLADLERQLVRNRGQQKRLGRLRDLIHKQFYEIQTTIYARQNRNFERRWKHVASVRPRSSSGFPQAGRGGERQRPART